jgi:N-ethylmaleimide reductase
VPERFTEPEVPEEMTVNDIRQTISDWVAAAKRAIDAGFDGVELHSAGGLVIFKN